MLWRTTLIAHQSGQKSSFLFWLLDIFLCYQNVPGLEFCKSFTFRVALLPVKDSYNCEMGMRGMVKCRTDHKILRNEKLSVVHVPRILTVDYTFKRKIRMRFYNFRHRCPNDELAIYIKCSVIVCLRRV